MLDNVKETFGRGLFLQEEVLRLKSIRSTVNKEEFPRYNATLTLAIEKADDAWSKIVEMLSLVDDSTTRLVLEMRFLEGANIEDICEEMYFSRRTVYRRLEQGLSIIAEKLKNKEESEND